MFQHDHAAWVSPIRPITGPAFIPARIDTIVIHYTAADDLIDGDPGEHASNLPAYMRAMQASYLRTRGYSLGYNVAVDWLGGSWEIRGTRFRCAANKGHNEHTFAILMLVDGNDMATPLAAATVRRIVAEIEALAGRRLAIVGHGQLTNPDAATACPGGGLRAQIELGELDPRWIDPTAVLPPPVVPALPTEVSLPMYVIVSNSDNPSDPRRWLYDGFRCRYLASEDDVNEARMFGWLHPSTSIHSPHRKPLAWIVSLEADPVLALTEPERIALIAVLGTSVPAVLGFLGIYVQNRRNTSAQRGDHASTAAKIDAMALDMADVRTDMADVKTDMRDMRDEQRSHGDRLRHLEQWNVMSDANAQTRVDIAANAAEVAIIRQPRQRKAPVNQLRDLLRQIADLLFGKLPPVARRVVYALLGIVNLTLVVLYAIPGDSPVTVAFEAITAAANFLGLTLAHANVTDADA